MIPGKVQNQGEKMNPSKRALTNLLKDLEATPDIEASAVSSIQGYMMASALPQCAKEDRIAFMSAALLLLGEQATRELALGKLSNVYVRGKDGFVMLMNSGENAVVTGLVRKGAETATVLVDMEQIAEKIADMV